MRNALLGLGLLAALATACGRTASDSAIYVYVTAAAGMPPVVQLRATLSHSGAATSQLYPTTASPIALSFNPAVTIVMPMPPSHSGSVVVEIDALDANGAVVAHGESSVSIVSDGRTEVTVVLQMGGLADAGVADAATSKLDVAPFDASPETPGSAGGAGGSGTVPPSRTGGAAGSGGMTTTSGTAGSIGCPAAPFGAAVNFCNGQGQGVMTGQGWVALGAADTVTSPVCDRTTTGGGASERITVDNPCPEADGTIVWSRPDALCISGSVPVVSGGDYNRNWGLMIGVSASDPEGTSLGGVFSTLTLYTQGTITPTNTAIRARLHRKGDPGNIGYCATIMSGQPAWLTAFNTACWDGSGDDLSEEDVPLIDSVAVQISADDRRAYTVSDFCLTGIGFDGWTPGAGGAGGTGGKPGTGGSGGMGGSMNCSPIVQDATREPTDVLLVLGQNVSMDYSMAGDCYCSDALGAPPCADTSSCTSRQAAVELALAGTLAGTENVNWGLKLFPTSAAATCSASSTMEVMIGADSVDAIARRVGSSLLDLGSPTAGAIKAGVDYLATVEDGHPKNLLLLTDSEPSCAGGSTDWKTPDWDGAVAAADVASSAGFPVYVIGLGPNLGNLTMLAQAGGTLDYYPASSPQQLSDALAAISKLATTCTFLLGMQPPDPRNVAVYLDKMLIEKDGIDGWSYGADTQRLVLLGGSCERVKAGTATTVTALSGCPPIKVFPPLLP